MFLEATSMENGSEVIMLRRQRKVNILTFDLAQEQGRSEFTQYQDAFLAVLEKAYGSRSIGSALHVHRIYSEQHLVLLALDDQESAGTLCVIGCSYIRPDGKRSALAVLPQLQGQGIARQLIHASFNCIPHQFVEVGVQSLLMHSLLYDCGFTPVCSEDKLKDYLGVNIIRLVSVRWENNMLTYTRYSESRPALLLELVMYQRV